MRRFSTLKHIPNPTLSIPSITASEVIRSPPVGGLYYLWTKILGKKLPSFASVQRGHRIGKTGGGRSGIGSGNNNRQAEIQAARERQQQRLQNAARAREMVNQATNNGNIRERTNITNTSSGNNALSIQQQQRLLQQQKLEKQKLEELESKKEKQRLLYLKQKELKEKEEEMKKKDEELGPGWRYR